MTSQRPPFSFGKRKFKNPVFYAPLAGWSDLPYRKMSAKYSPGLIYCEMVKMEALIRNDINTFHLLDYEADMHPIGAQLVGSNLAIAGEAARIIEDLGFDVLDFNCGCPVDKVTKDGSGSGMLKHPEKIGEILEKMVAAVSIPVTVKIRAGWDDDLIFASEITEIAEAAGASAISIHGRTRMQGYKGSANWEYIKAAKNVANEIKVIGNGDVFDAASAEKMLAMTGCDAVLCARGTMGQPWIAEDICRHLNGEAPIVRSDQFVRESFLEHFRYACDYYPEKKAVTDMRRLGIWYFNKKGRCTKDFRKAITKVVTKEDVFEVIDHFWTS